MQQPIDKTGALYGEFKTYDVYDLDKVAEELLTQIPRITARLLCQICADEIDGYLYIADIYYTDEGMEVTEKEAARRLTIAGTKEI